MEPEVIADRYEISDALVRYATAVDTKDWSLWKSVFTADAHVDLTSGGGIAGTRDDVADYLEAILAMVPKTQHFVANIDVTFEGDTADVVAMFFNPISYSGSRNLSFRSGRYVHDFVRAPDGWKSQRFVEEVEWSLR